LAFLTDSKRYPFGERASFVADPNKALEISCSENAHFLEIQWQLNADDQAGLSKHKTIFPLMQIYSECEQYRETYKSQKTISRSIIGHHELPRFCMGTNESYGPDRVGIHEHPLIDQFFYSFSENDVILLIDGKRQPYKGNTLIHFPRVSKHGMEIPEGKKMHYLWMDFIMDPKGVDFLDEVHKMTGVKQSFSQDHRIS